MLARLQSVPHTDNEWSSWSRNNYSCLNQIRQAIRVQTGLNLPEYQVEPIPWNSIDTFLSNNQQAHNDFNGALGLQSNDLEQVDLKNPQELPAWIYLNFFELQQACFKLKIGP